MTQFIGVTLVLALTLAVMPTLAWVQAEGGYSTHYQWVIAAQSGATSSAPAAGQNSTPPGQGGTPPGQAKQAEPDLDEADATGFLDASSQATGEIGFRFHRDN